MDNSFNIEKNIIEVNTDIKYNKSDDQKIKGSVLELFDSLNNDRQTQIDLIDIIENMVNPKDTSVKKEEDKLIPYLKDPAIIRILETAVSQTYNSTFKNPNLLFNTEFVEDFEGESFQETLFTETEEEPIPGYLEKLELSKKNQCLIQKQVILEVIKKANAKTEFRKGVRNFYKKGEFILKLTWNQEYVLNRKNSTFQYNENGADIEMNKKIVTKELVYDGVKIKCIDPKDFLWDTSYDNFDDAPKMSRVYLPFNKIKSNEVYKDFLSKEDLEKLSEIVKAGKTDNTNLDEDYDYDNTQGVKGKLLEVIEFEGDIYIGDDFYENIKVVIVGRTAVACFMYNQQLSSQYLYCPYDIDEETGRGIGLIARLMNVSQATTDILRKLHRALGLSINKCYLAPEGAFSGDLEIAENAIIEFNKSIEDAGKLIPLDFQAALNAAMSYLQYLKGEMEESTLRFKYSSGDSPKQSKTLGEVQIITEAQNTLSSYELDKLYDEIIIPMAERIGQIVANTEEGERRIKYTNHLGENSVGVVDDTVRTSKYSYEINEPQNSAAKKLNNLQLMDKVLSSLAPYMQATQQGKISAKELLKIVGGSFDIVNPDKLILQEEMQPQVQVQGNVGGLPENAQGIPELNQAIQAQVPNGGINLEALDQAPNPLVQGG